jgi:predicted solute-binding protein
MMAAIADMSARPGHGTGVASVVLVNNVSVEPFRLLAPAFGVTVRRDFPPSEAWALAAGGAADLAVVPVVKLPDVARVMEPIGDFGVACRGPVGSVLLFGTASLADLVRRRLPIHLTTQSETPRRLLCLLCWREFGIEPVLCAEASKAAAWLCIGDEALRRRQDTGRPPVVVDLCEWWEQQTQQPFVFARWMVRRTATAAFKELAAHWLDNCADAARTAAGRKTMATRTVQSGLFAAHDAASAYFDRIRSRFGADDKGGEALFLSELARCHAQ